MRDHPIFRQKPEGGPYDPLNQEEIETSHFLTKSLGLFSVFLYMPSLPNIAFKESKFYRRSIHSHAVDLHRAEQLSTQYLINRIGHRMEVFEDEAIETTSLN